MRMYCVRSVGTSCLETIACSTSVTSVSHSSMSRSALPYKTRGGEGDEKGKDFPRINVL